MSLTSGEQRTLAEIESQLCGSDPGLAAMFARFTAGGPGSGFLAAWLPRYRHGPGGHGPGGHGPGGHGPGGPARVIILILAGVTLFITAIAVAAVATLHAAPPHGAHVPGTHQAGSYSSLG